MRAILSDIHGNLEAPQAVLADAADHGVDEIICLGDTVGYGPNPIECLRLSMSWHVVLQGNIDFAITSGDGLSKCSALIARRSILWSRKILAQTQDAARLDTFLAQRPHSHQEDATVFVHASPRNPLNEYLFPEDICNPQKLVGVAKSFSSYCFNGHTHLAGVIAEDQPTTSRLLRPATWTQRKSTAWRYLSSKECPDGYRLTGHKAVINVGSVGQPRGQDWRASYVLFDGELVRFRRVEYDIDATVGKINANPELDGFLADRLREGR